MRTGTSKTSSLLRLAIPVALAHVANISLQLVDMAFVGPLGPESLGGLSIGNAIYITLMVSAIGLLMGLEFLASRAIGAGNQTEANTMLVQGLYLATALSLPLIIIMHLATRAYLPFGIDPAIAEKGTAFLKALSWSLWPWLLFNAFRQYLQAMGIAVPILIIMILANGVNALGNWIFVYGHWGVPAQGVAGSGWSTTTARIFMLVSVIGYTAVRNRRYGLGLEHVSLRVMADRMKMLIRVGGPAGVQLLLEVAVFALSTLLAGKLGAFSLAAHQIVFQIASFTFMFPLGVASATAVHVARAVGADRWDDAVHVGWRGIWIGGLFMLVCGVLLSVLARPILQLFTNDPKVLEIGSKVVLLAALFQIFDGVQVVGAGVLRGIGNTRTSMLANLVGHWFLGLPIGAALCFVAGWGIYGLWVGLTLGLVFVSIALVWMWRVIVKEKAPNLA